MGMRGPENTQQAKIRNDTVGSAVEALYDLFAVHEEILDMIFGYSVIVLFDQFFNTDEIDKENGEQSQFSAQQPESFRFNGRLSIWP